MPDPCTFLHTILIETVIINITQCAFNIKDRSNHIPRFTIVVNYNEAISDKRAKPIVDEHFAIEIESLKAKLAMVKKMRNVLPEIIVLKFFQLEEKFEAGLLYQFADSQPVVK